MLLKFILKGPIDNKSALVQEMAWWQVITWNYDVLEHHCIYVTFSLNELMAKHWIKYILKI